MLLCQSLISTLPTVTRAGLFRDVFARASALAAKLERATRRRAAYTSMMNLGRSMSYVYDRVIC